MSITEKQDNTGAFLKIRSLREESKAHESGLRIGDRIMEIQGFPITSRKDVQVALAGTKAGDRVNIKISRNSANTIATENLTVELYDGSESR